MSDHLQSSSKLVKFGDQLRTYGHGQKWSSKSPFKNVKKIVVTVSGHTWDRIFITVGVARLIVNMFRPHHRQNQTDQIFNMIPFQTALAKFIISDYDHAMYIF